MIKKIAILTSGGDAPGMNAAIRAIVKSAHCNNIETYVVKQGYLGLYKGDIVKVNNDDIEHILNLGGTFIFSARFPEFKDIANRKIAKKNLDKLGIDALVVIGGDGSYKGAQKLSELGINSIALPGTIDNDIASTDFTIGFFTAWNTIVNSIAQIRDTMNSHHRIGIVEVMGNKCQDLSFFSGISSDVDYTAMPDEVLTAKDVARIYEISKKNKKNSCLILVTEKTYKNIHEFASKIEKETKVVTRATSLGHIQRGGMPVPMDKYIATMMGNKAVELLIAGKSSRCIGIVNNKFVDYDIERALDQPRTNRTEMVRIINKINR